MTDQNHAVYERPDVVRFYASQQHLQAGERAVLDMVEERLPSLDVLDIGVGGGRTTAHLAPRARAYLGIDYAPRMIAAARKRFAEEKAWRLEVEDARRLSLADASFGFALFSHCGIDYVDHGDRLRILAEVHRVLSPGSIFAMSTHNLQRARDLLHGCARDGRLKRVAGALSRWRLRRANEPLETLESRPHAVINDGAFRFGVRTYHIRPRAQREQLEKVGFRDVRVFSAATGKPIDDAVLDSVSEPWLMYSCERR